MPASPIAAFLLAAVIASASVGARAQQQDLHIPGAIASLEQSASSKTGFTFDHSMLVFASKLEPNNGDLRRVIAGVNGVSVHNYRFQSPGQYDPAALRSIAEEYRAAGWTQLVNKREVSADPAAPRLTDLWLRMENNAVSNIAVLVARPGEISFVTVSGSLSPVDISHLGGHFGIPKIEGGVLIPNSSAH